MKNTKKINKNEIIDVSGYVDQSTGHILPEGTVVSVQKDTDTVEISYDNYSVIDTEVIDYLSTVLGYSDLGKVMRLSTTTATPLNLIMNGNNTFHSNESLQKYLNIKSESMFFKFIRKIMKLGIIYQIKGQIHGSVRKIYMLNPFMSRRRRTFDDKVLSVFSKIIND